MYYARVKICLLSTNVVVEKEEQQDRDEKQEDNKFMEPRTLHDNTECQRIRFVKNIHVLLSHVSSVKVFSKNTSVHFFSFLLLSSC